MRGLGKWNTQLDRLLATARPHHLDAIVRNSRQVPPSTQPEKLTEALQSLDDAGRQAVYASLTDAELEALCGDGVQAYLATLPDATIQRIAEDRTGRAAQREYRKYRTWRRYR